MHIDYDLNSKDTLTALAKNNGIDSWLKLTEFVKNLPYGRNTNRIDLGLVLSEKKGTCSSKHALLKSIATLNNIPDVDLIVGVYRMNHLNTPKIGTLLIDHSIAFIPEAHCYLKINGVRTDLTTQDADFKKIEKDIIQEKVITPEQVATFKINYHKEFIKNWLETTDYKLNFSQTWDIREKCITRLTA